MVEIEEVNNITNATETPAELTISGADGNNAAIINGLYVLQDFLFNDRPIYLKDESPTETNKKWLACMTNEFWYVTESRNKERNTPGGWLKAKGVSPTSVAQWSKLKNGAWELCPKVKVKPHVKAPYPTKVAHTDIATSGPVSVLRKQLANANAAAKRRVRFASDQVTQCALSTKEKGREIVTDQRTQVTVASAAAGAAVGGTTGGAVGAVAGAGTGALVGLPAALFTFGLSVPLCADIGGATGCAAGATIGGTAGGAVGGAAGYNVHKYRKEIGTGTASAWGKVRARTQLLKAAAAKRLGGASPELVAQPAC